MILLSFIAKALIVFLTWTTPRTWVPGELVTAAQLNTHLRDNLNSVRSEHFTVQRFRGLQLRTSPDATIAAKTVTLITADEIVMDDASRLTSWGGQIADVTVAGAGGLDTGSEGASRWYEIYAIAKDDGTKNLLLHRSKNYSMDTSFVTARDASRALRRATGTATDRLAQGIQFANAGPFSYIDVEVVRAGAVSGNIWFSIQASVSGDASGTPLATTDKIDASAISTSNQIIRLIFRTPFTEVAATQYHLVMEGDYTRSDSVNIAWRGVAAGGYANGVAREYNGAAWANASGVGDFYFQAAIVANDTAVTMPSGYTKKALVGYVYNNSGSDFKKFIANDKRVTYDTAVQIASTTSTAALLADLSALLPPVGCAIRTFIFSNDTTAALIYVVPQFALGQSQNFGIYFTEAVGGYLNHHGGVVPVEYQHAYVSVTAGTGVAYIAAWSW